LFWRSQNLCLDLNLILDLNFFMQNITVIGGGLMGSAAAWHLSKRGERVLLLEQQDRVYEYGSSFGDSRISRSLGPQDDIFSYLNNTSVELTRELIDFLNKNDTETHRMTDVYTTSPVTYIYDKTLQEEVNQLLHNQQKDKCKHATSKNALATFGMTIPDSLTVIREYKEHSGTMHPLTLINKLHTAIRKCESHILFHRKILTINKKYNYYVITFTGTKTGQTTQLSTKQLIVAAGAYTGELLKDIEPRIAELIMPKRMSLCYFKINKKTYENYTEKEKTRLQDMFPVFDLRGKQLYAMIEKTDTDGLPVFKVGGHRMYNTLTSVDEAWKIPPTEEEIEWTQNEWFNYLKINNLPIKKENIEYVEGRSCVYSLTATSVPLVSHFPIKELQSDIQSIVIGGMSGIGAKGAMCYGWIAANLLMNKKNKETMYQKTKKALAL